MWRGHFRVGGCVRVKYLRKPSPLFQLPHELLSGGAAIFIPPDCILLSFSNENFKKSHHEAKSCRTDTAFSHKPGPDRRFGRMRSCQQPRAQKWRGPTLQGIRSCCLCCFCCQSPAGCCTSGRIKQQNLYSLSEL